MAATTLPHPAETNDRREIFGWAMYDWANSAFSTTIGTVFLGPYLASLAALAAGDGPKGLAQVAGISIAPDSFFLLCVSLSVLLQACFLPILGAIADYSHLRKRMLQLFATVGAIATIALFLVTASLWWLGGLLFIIANLSFGAAIVFYNSYLPNIASEDQRDRVSSYGWAMGYLGGGLLLLLNLIFFLGHDRFGVQEGLAVRVCLASAGVWWLGFSFITWARLRSRRAARSLPKGEGYASVGFKQLSTLLKIPTSVVAILLLSPLLIIPIMLAVISSLGWSIYALFIGSIGPIAFLALFLWRRYRDMPEAVKYLLAYFLYNDGIQTVIAAAATFAAAPIARGGIGLDLTTLTEVTLAIQFVAFGGALLWGRLAGWVGAKRSIFISLVIWAGVVIYAYGGVKGAARVLEFWVLGLIIALVLGGSQAISRSLFSQFVPRGKEAEFYSFYEISERGTSWIGPFLFAAVNQMAGNLRPAILSLIFFFIAGMIILPFVNVPKGMEDMKRYEAEQMGEAAASTD